MTHLRDANQSFTSLTSRILAGIQGLFPGYFALVMATGIVSIGSKLLAVPFIATPLLYLNGSMYAVLSLMLFTRIVLYPRHVFHDLCDHNRGPGFFTVVAGTCVLGTQSLVVGEAPSVARVLWFLGIGLWCVVMYSFFTAVVVRKEKPPLETGINGAWLIATVATQAVSVLGSLLAKTMDHPGPVLFFTLCFYMLGAMLYLAIITLIFYRFTFLPMSIEGMTPPYWINMGAVAITTLAGSTLLLSRNASPLLQMLQPFVTGFTLFFWVTATWWIPLLVILFVWRHAVHKFPLRYDPTYWGMVFPLGMYTTSTTRLSQATGLSYLLAIPQCFIYVALTAWTIVFTAMVMTLWGPKKQLSLSSSPAA